MMDKEMKYSGVDHTFAVCAYGQSRYLEECIRSLTQQQVKGNIIIGTSTPNDHIGRVAAKYGLPVYVNEGTHGLGGDWNFAYSQAKTALVTLAHQDDVYEPAYLGKMLERINGTKLPLICFSDYFELRNGKRVYSDDSKLLRVKKLMLLPLKPHALQSSRWVRRRALSLGNPICCPSVTYVRDNLPEVVFETRYASNIDWLAWEQLSRRKGCFCYVPEPLMGHRIHQESTTSEVIGNSNGRSNEDLEMLQRFWPRPIAKMVNRVYSGAQRENKT